MTGNDFLLVIAEHSFTTVCRNGFIKAFWLHFTSTHKTTSYCGLKLYACFLYWRHWLCYVTRLLPANCYHLNNATKKVGSRYYVWVRQVKFKCPTINQWLGTLTICFYSCVSTAGSAEDTAGAADIGLSGTSITARSSILTSLLSVVCCPTWPMILW